LRPAQPGDLVHLDDRKEAVMSATVPMSATRAVSAAAAPPRVSALRVFLALLERDFVVARRDVVGLLIRTALQPLLGVAVFGYILPHMGFMNRGYPSALLPGIIAICLSLASLQSVALPMITDFGFTKEIEDRLLAPAANQLVAIEKVVSGML